MVNVIWAILAFLVAITLLVAFHEYGHFLVARLFSVKVLRFSIGFGRPLFRHQFKSGTEFVVGWLPLGGYVKMLDENEAPVSAAELPYAFNRQPVWKRMLIVLAGPFFNLIFAVFAYWLMFTIGIAALVPILGKITPNTAIANLGLQTGDEVIAVNGKLTPSWETLTIALIRHVGDRQPVVITVKKSQTQQVQSYQLNLRDWQLESKKPNLLKALGFNQYLPPIKPVVAKVADNSPAAKAGIKPGDIIVAIADQPIHDWQEFPSRLKPYLGKMVTITLLRQNQKINLIIQPKAYDSPIGKIARIGVESAPLKLPKNLMRQIRYSPLNAWKPALQQTGTMISLTYVLLYKMVMGDISMKTMSGPIGIAQGAGYMAQLGISYYLAFLALISISLAIINLLPIPLLDGGHLLYYVIEVIRGKPLSKSAQEVGLQIGLIFLVFLVLFAIFNDISRLL